MNNVIVIVKWKRAYSNAIGRAGKNPERRNMSNGANVGKWKRGCYSGKLLKYYKHCFTKNWDRETGFRYHAIIWTQVQYFEGFKIWYNIGRFCEWKAKIIVSLHISFFFKLKFLSFSYYSGEDNPANLPQQQQEQGMEWISFLHRWSGLVWGTVREVSSLNADPVSL